MSFASARIMLVLSLAACGAPPQAPPVTAAAPTGGIAEPAAPTPPAPAATAPATTSEAAPPAAPTPAKAEAPTCAELAKACHGHAEHNDKVKACHELGHAAPSEAECVAKKADCLKLCKGAHAH